MHIESTLLQLEKATKSIGKELRGFQEWTSTGFNVKELPKEADKHTRQKQKKKGGSTPATGVTPSSSVGPAATLLETGAAPSILAKPKSKLFDLCTYKMHALGDYVQAIQLYGTTDSYSTQIVYCFFKLLN